MTKRRQLQGWGNVFGLVKKQNCEYYLRLQSDRTSLMKQLKDILEKANVTKVLDKMEVHSVMLSLNCCDEAIIEAHRNDPKEGYRDLIGETPQSLH